MGVVAIAVVPLVAADVVVGVLEEPSMVLEVSVEVLVMAVVIDVDVTVVDDVVTGRRPKTKSHQCIHHFGR